MIGEQRRRRIGLGTLAVALAVLVVMGGALGAGAVDKTRYPGYQGPDLAANCDALDEWEIDTATYPECGPGGDENSEECSAQNVEGCVFDPLPGWQVAGGPAAGSSHSSARSLLPPNAAPFRSSRLTSSVSRPSAAASAGCDSSGAGNVPRGRRGGGSRSSSSSGRVMGSRARERVGDRA